MGWRGRRCWSSPPRPAGPAARSSPTPSRPPARATSSRTAGSPPTRARTGASSARRTAGCSMPWPICWCRPPEPGWSAVTPVVTRRHRPDARSGASMAAAPTSVPARRRSRPLAPTRRRSRHLSNCAASLRTLHQPTPHGLTRCCRCVSPAGSASPAWSRWRCASSRWRPCCAAAAEVAFCVDTHTIEVYYGGVFYTFLSAAGVVTSFNGRTGAVVRRAVG